MRKTALYLAMLLAVSQIVSCGGEAMPGETKTPDTTTEPEVTSASDDPGLPDKTFGGAEVNFLTISERHNANNYSIEVFAGEMNGEPINDAVYKRNTFVEEKYDVKITETKSDDPKTDANLSIMAGDDTYQVLLVGMDECMGIAQDGGLVDLNEVPYIDLSRSWWDQRVNDAMTFGGITYLAAGDINIMDDNATWVTFFNKRIAEDYNLPDLYEVVDSGKWTMDELLKNARLTNTDLDGDSEITYKDRFGIGTDDWNFSNLLLGAGCKYWQDNGSTLECVFYNDKTLSVCDKIFDIFYDEPTTVNSDLYWGIVEGTPNSTVLRKSFGEDRMTFYIASMLTYSLMRGMESDFGLLPLPKYDESQENYISSILPRNASSLSIPKTNQNLEMTGIVVEAMAAKSSTTLTPAYYDYTIYGKGMRDEDSARMFDLVKQNRAVDIGAVFDFGGLIAGLHKLLHNDSRDVASCYASLIDGAKEAAKKTIEEIYN